MSEREIAAYYDHVQKWFTWFYSDRESLGLHYGFWEPQTKNRAEALVNQYREVAKRLGPIEGQRFLDAGCGVGGACLWLAKRFPGRFVGITLSETQRKVAEHHARQRGLSNTTEFYRMNFLATTFPDGSFDGVFGNESFCYSYPRPERLFTELYRLLLADDFCSGYAMEGWNTVREVREALVRTGFQDIQWNDKTGAIKPSVEDIRRRHTLFEMVLRIGRALRLVTSDEVRSLRATGAQSELYRRGIFGYGIVSARK
jgi:SAM-dependent methyltransferase